MKPTKLTKREWFGFIGIFIVVFFGVLSLFLPEVWGYYAGYAPSSSAVPAVSTQVVDTCSDANAKSLSDLLRDNNGSKLVQVFGVQGAVGIPGVVYPTKSITTATLVVPDCTETYIIMLTNGFISNGYVTQSDGFAGPPKKIEIDQLAKIWIDFTFYS